METTHIQETPESIISTLVGLSIDPSATDEQIENVFNRFSGMTISELHASKAFHLVFDWHDFADCSTKSVWHDIIKPMFEGMGCKIVSHSDYESVL